MNNADDRAAVRAGWEYQQAARQACDACRSQHLVQIHASAPAVAALVQMHKPAGNGEDGRAGPERRRQAAEGAGGSSDNSLRRTASGGKQKAVIRMAHCRTPPILPLSALAHAFLCAAASPVPCCSRAGSACEQCLICSVTK